MLVVSNCQVSGEPAYCNTLTTHISQQQQAYLPNLTLSGVANLGANAELKTWLSQGVWFAEIQSAVGFPHAASQLYAYYSTG